MVGAELAGARQRRPRIALGVAAGDGHPHFLCEQRARVQLFEQCSLQLLLHRLPLFAAVLAGAEANLGEDDGLAHLARPEIGGADGNRLAPRRSLGARGEETGERDDCQNPRHGASVSLAP